MRLILLVFITTLNSLLFAQIKKKEDGPFANTNKKTEITGSIKNYKANDNNRFIIFRTYDIGGTIKDTAFFINETGNFKAKLSQVYESDIDMMFADEFVTLYAGPGEKILLEIDADKLKQEKDKGKAINVTGRSAAISKLIMQFKLTGEEFLLPEENWADSTLTDSVIADARIKRMKKEIDSLNTWIKKRAITNKTFATWARNKIVYEAGFDIAFNLYTGKRRKSNDRQLIDFTKDIPLNNPSALNNSGYYHFLHLMAIDMQIVVNINPMYDSVRRKMGKNSVPVYLEKIDTYSRGLAKQLMYYHTFNSNSAEKTGPYIEDFDSVITMPYLRKLVIAKKNTTPFQPFNIIQRLKEFPVDDSMKTRLISLFESNKKNLFIDFWGSWCMPCMHEMPFFPKLISEFKNSELQFLFFAVETSEEKVTEIKNKYGIDAPFIVLTENEVRILNNVLQFSSYPSHFIIGPNGMVREKFGIKINSGDTLSEVALDKMKKYSALWY